MLQVSRIATQEFPYPTDLENAVRELQYLPGWRVTLTDEDRGQGCKGLTLNVYPNNPDSYHPEKHVGTVFLYAVPAAAFNRESWEEWVWERIEETEGHERSEWFRFITVCCAHPESAHEKRPGQFHCWECGATSATNAWHEYHPPIERRPFKPAHADGWNPGVVRAVVSESVANTPNAGRLVTVDCLCGHRHRARMGEHFAVGPVLPCEDCACLSQVLI